MKKSIKTVLFFLLSLICPIVSATETEVILKPLPSDNLDDDEDHSGRGHRSQSIRVTCSIDYDANEVTLTPAREEEILTYEIWDADGCVCLGIYFDASSFLGHLSQLSEATIVLHTESKSYSGYYSN
ncbi:MAG: hypothetical protein ACI30O_00880 [Muribaculaceae bacterium]